MSAGNGYAGLQVLTELPGHTRELSGPAVCICRPAAIDGDARKERRQQSLCLPVHASPTLRSSSITDGAR